MLVCGLRGMRGARVLRRWPRFRVMSGVVEEQISFPTSARDDGAVIYPTVLVNNRKHGWYFPTVRAKQTRVIVSHGVKYFGG